MEFWGFQFNRKKVTPPVSVAPPIRDDGAVVVIPTGGAYGTYVDLDGAVKSEAELITRYRIMAAHHEVDSAIDDIVNEAIINDEDQEIVSLNLDDVESLSDSLKKKVNDEFKTVINLLSFSKEAYEIFRHWYVDGRILYHVIIDNAAPSRGIQEIRYLDPRKIRKVREVKKSTVTANNQTANVYQDKEEYFIYNDKGFLSAKETPINAQAGLSGIKISADSIIQVTSGITDEYNKMVLSYLHKAQKPLNQLKSLEDATLIYKLARAPERRIFYVDVGDLPKGKAEQYMSDIMNKFKNKLVYDSSTGEIRDDRKFMTMLEDFWLPRRNGKGTEVTTLQGGTQLGEMEEINYFQKNLWRSLNVPVSRMDADSTFNLGRSSEITRDEIKFHKFITRLQLRFSLLFSRALEKQLILKRIITPEEWNQIEKGIKYRYAVDNYYSELKDNEVIRGRFELLAMIDPYVGRYVSNESVRRNIIRQTEEEMKEEDKKIQDESLNPQYQQVEPPDVITPSTPSAGGKNRQEEVELSIDTLSSEERAILTEVNNILTELNKDGTS